MTITTNDDRDEYTATSGQTVFNYTFRIYESTDLNVYQTPAGQAFNDSTDIITAYTVSGVNSPGGGSITLNSGAATGDRITIVSDIPSSRTTDYQVSGDFTAATVNEDIDRTVSLQKQAEGIARRSVLFPQSEQGVSAKTLDTPDALKYWRWKSDNSGVEYVDLPTISTTDSTFAVDDYPALKALDITGISNNQIVKIAYRANEGDGGHGDFRFDDSDNSASVTADPGQGIYVPPNSDTSGASGCWVRQYSGALNVKWFGATGNGSTDDTTAIQNAIDQARNTASTTAEVYMPAGTYITSSTLNITTNFLKLRGDSLGGYSGTETSSTIIQSTAAKIIYSAVQAQGGTEFEGLTIKGNSSTTHGIHLYTGNRSTVKRCSLEDMQTGIGLQIGDAATTLLWAVVEELMTRDVMKCIKLEGYAGSCRINKCQLSSLISGQRIAGTYGIWTEGTGDFLNVTDTTIDSMEKGIILDSKFNHISCRFEDNGNSIEINNQNNTVYDCEFHMIDVPDAVNFIYIDAAATEFYIYENRYLVSNSPSVTYINDNSAGAGDPLTVRANAYIHEPQLNLYLESREDPGVAMEKRLYNGTTTNSSSAAYRTYCNKEAIKGVLMSERESGGTSRVVVGSDSAVPLDIICNSQSAININNSTYYLTLQNGTVIAFGANSPNGVVTAPVGSTYHRSGGGAGTSFYVKESGTGNTGWVAK